MASSELTSPAVPSGVVVTPPAQLRPRHDDLPSGLRPDDLARADDPATPHVATVTALGRPAVAAPGGVVDDGETGRGTPLQALAGWGAALVVGAACWGGALAVVTRLV